MEQRLFCNKGIEMMKNCAITVQTTIEAHTFWNKRASSITITTDEIHLYNGNLVYQECYPSRWLKL